MENSTTKDGERDKVISFLEAKGIYLPNVSFVVYIEGAMRSPDLVNLIMEYTKTAH